VTAVPLRAGKARSGVVVVLSDADLARQFEQNVRRLDRLASIGTLSAGMAHEIKNALVSVKTFIDLLLDRNQDAELADVVGREMRRINALVSQTLKFAGPARPVFSAVRLHDVLDQSLRMVQPQLRTKLITLNRSYQAVPDVVCGDDYQIEQVFVNLFLNAIEAMNSTGSLNVSTEIVPAPPVSRKSREAVSHVRVMVADTGMGIAAEDMGRLFEPFFTTKEDGTGLGLAIARRIVTEHKGDIHVRSETNKGTTFSVVLPSHATGDLSPALARETARERIPQRSRPRETF
jgi:signal transduction histidine kinase